MLRRFVLLVICGLAPVFVVRAQGEAPLAAELYLGAEAGEVRLIWVPTRWTSQVSLVRLKRRMVGATEWQKLDGMQFVGQREKIALENAQPADFKQLRDELLTDFSRAWRRGFAYGDDVANLPSGNYEYGVFVRPVGADFLEQPVATAVWKPGPPIDRNAGIQALGVFRDAAGVQVQFRVDPRRLAEHAVGVRVIEVRDGLPKNVHESLLIPATRDGWTAICHRPKDPWPTAVTVRAEDMFGFWSQETVEIPVGVKFAKPPVEQRACMPVRASAKQVPKPPPARLSADVELLVGARHFNARVLWIPKRWPEGMEGAQIMRRRAGAEWVPIREVSRPSIDYLSRLKSATPADFAKIREELRGGWSKPFTSGFGTIDLDFKELPEGVVEYGVFPIFSGKRAAQPIATAPLLVGSDVDLDFGIATPQVVRDQTGLVAVFPLDPVKFNAKGGIIDVYMIMSDGTQRRFTQVPALAKPSSWKQICMPVGDTRITGARIDVQDVLGFDTSVSVPIGTRELPLSGAAATRDCFVPPPTVQSVSDRGLPPPPPSPATPPAIVSSARSMPTPPPPPRPQPNPASSIAREPVDAGTLLAAAWMWFDASERVKLEDGHVAAWSDKTSNGFVATMNDPNRRPTLESAAGIAALHFAGGQSLHLERPLQLRAGTIFIVGRSGGHRMRNIILGPVGNNKNNQLRWEDDENVLIVGPNDGTSIVNLPAGDTGSMHVLAVSYDGASVGFWRNGEASPVYKFRKPGSEGYSFNSIGSYYSQMYLTGDIAAIVVLPQVLLPAEMKSVDATLRDRYRIR